jgi:hypothetical protein
MTRIIKESEKSIEYTYEDFSYKNLTERDKEKKLLIKNGLKLSDELKAKVMIVFTRS